MKKLIKVIKEKLLNRKFLSFGIIGVFNTLLSQLLYLLFLMINLPISVSSVAGDSIPIIFSFFMNMHFTYHEKPTWRKFITFPLSYVPGIIINLVFVLIFVNIFHIEKEYCKILALPFTMVINFFTMGFILKITKDYEEKLAEKKAIGK